VSARDERLLEGLEGNPVARAHARPSRRSDSAGGSIAGQAAVWLIVVPTIIGLVSNPIGWLLLFLLCIGAGAAFGLGGLL
jgi:hypothetical protein